MSFHIFHAQFQEEFALCSSRGRMCGRGGERRGGKNGSSFPSHIASFSIRFMCMHFTCASVCLSVYFIYLFTWPALVDGPQPACCWSSLGPAAPAASAAPVPAPDPRAACRLGKEEYCNGWQIYFVVVCPWPLAVFSFCLGFLQCVSPAMHIKMLKHTHSHTQCYIHRHTHACIFIIENFFGHNL